MSRFIFSTLTAFVLTAVPVLVFAVAPPTPSVQTSGNRVSGESTPGSVVIVTTSGGSACTANVGDDRQYSCTLPDSAARPLQNGEKVFVRARNPETGELSAINEDATLSITAEQSRGFLRDGIFGCAAGTYGMPVGTLSAIGGVYVPVNDAAVTQNTGYLVYKECVLDGVVVRMREAASGAVVKNILTWANSGRGGNPVFVDNQAAYYQQKIDRVILENIKDYNLSGLCTQYRPAVKRAILENWVRITRQPQSSYSCPSGMTSEQVAECLSGRGGVEACGGWEGWMNLVSEPGSTPLGAYINAQARSDREVAAQLSILRDELLQGNGFAPTDTYTSNPTDTGEDRVERRIVTPGYLISQLVSQAAGSGFRQLENASEIDQIVNSLFSGITQQILTGSGGLKGLNQSVLGKPPYLDQLAAEASAGVRTAAGNAALTLLNSSIASERAFGESKRTSKDAVDQAEAQLRAAEDRCWSIMIPKVQAYAQTAECSTDSEGAETCNPPKTLNISTSTPVIKTGTLALQIPEGTTVTSGSSYTLTSTPTSLIQSSETRFTAATNQEFASTTQVGLLINSVLAPTKGSNATMSITAKTPFGSGTIKIQLAANQLLPQGEVRFPLIAVAPFTQAAVSLTVGIQQQFAETVIETRTNPLLTTINKDITDSDNALTRLLQLANSVNNTSSLTAQRLALEEVDRLVADRLLHDAYSVKDAQQQAEVIGNQMSTLVEDTINDWGSGGGWCNAENTEVVRMWYDRWKVN